MNERLNKILNHPARVPVGVGLLAFGGGLVVGYFIGKRQRKEPAFLVLNDQELAKVNFDLERGHRLNAERDARMAQGTETFDDVVTEKLLTEVDNRIMRPPVSVAEVVFPIPDAEPEALVTVDGEVVRRSIFADSDADEDWDYNEEQRNRRPTDPYVIHKEEFFAETDEDLHQTTLIYYNGDDVLADEHDTPIYNHNAIVGELKFGHGSGDPNVVYIRNEVLKAEYEVLLDHGLFSVEVLGLSIENNQRAKDLRHSAVRKFRPE